MPSPRAGESREDFLDRCIPEVVAEGREPDQAVAMCIAYYEGEKDKAFNVDKMGEVEYWKAFERKRESFESKYERKLLKAFREQTKFLEEATTIQDLRGRINPEPMTKAIEELYSEVGDSFARSVFSGLKKMSDIQYKNFPQWRQNILNEIDYDRILAINGFTKEIFERTILSALQEGLSLQETIRRLREGGFSLARAKRIARTEIATASNAGSLVGALSTNLPFQKRWVHIEDGAVRGANPDDRFNHRNVKDVDKNDSFNVSGEMMKYPAQSGPGISPGNVINCRCTLVYITED